MNGKNYLLTHSRSSYVTCTLTNLSDGLVRVLLYDVKNVLYCGSKICGIPNQITTFNLPAKLLNFSGFLYLSTLEGFIGCLTIPW